jgi:hypothetical protein
MRYKCSIIQRAHIMTVQGRECLNQWFIIYKIYKEAAYRDMFQCTLIVIWAWCCIELISIINNVLDFQTKTEKVETTKFNFQNKNFLPYIISIGSRKMYATLLLKQTLNIRLLTCRFSSSKPRLWHKADSLYMATSDSQIVSKKNEWRRE